MRIRSKQIIAGVLALSAAFVGPWACFAPESFYRSFPVAGHHWVSRMGPYNEHMTRDVGALYLALLVISVWAVVRPHGETFALIGAAWLAFSVPHFVFHLFHLGMYDATDKIGNVVTLGGTLILAAVLFWPTAAGGGGPAVRGCLDQSPAQVNTTREVE